MERLDTWLYIPWEELERQGLPRRALDEVLLRKLWRERSGAEILPEEALEAYIGKYGVLAFRRRAENDFQEPMIQYHQYRQYQ